jgi:tripartite-type tricarboxylate transporter receptor subunit TctC
MKLPRRQFLHLAAGAAALPAVSRLARAQSYPTRPVHMIVGYAPAGGTDIFTRLLGQALSERIGQSFVVENRPGAASNLATEVVVRAPANGYTLITTDAAAAINATLYEKLNFNFVRDIAVVGMTRAPLVMEVHPSVPTKTVPEFITYAKANPGKIAMASAGIGSPPHLAGELFKALTGTNLTHVPYRGSGPATTDLLGGQVQVLFNGVAPAIEHVRSGRIRALAVTTATRLGVLPDVPTVAEFVPGYEASQWYAAGVRKDTPVEIIDKLNNDINACLADPKLTARLTDLGNTAFPGSAVAFAKFVVEETEKWGKVIRAANIKAE